MDPERVGLTAHNETGATLFVSVEVVRRDDKGHDQLLLSSQRVLGGSATSIRVDPLAMNTPFRAVEYAAQVRVMATFRTADGTLVGRAVAPNLYLHLEGRNPLVYGFETLMHTFNGGDVQAPRPWPEDPPLVYQAPSPPVNSLVDEIEEHPLAPDEIEFCFQYRYEFVDSGTGEDFYTAVDLDDMWMRASGIQATVVPPDAAEIAGRASDEGCMIAPFSEGIYAFDIPADVVMGSPGHAIHFVGRHDTPVHRWLPLFEAEAEHAGERVYIELENSHVTDVMAASTQVIRRILEDATPLVDAGFVLDTSGHPNVLCQVACKSGDTLFFRPDCDPNDEGWCDPGVTKEKYGIAHEVGHFIQNEYVLASSGISYLPEGNVDLEGCSFTSEDGPGAHALRSLEQSGAAMNEGFAHYIATLAWNRHRGDFGPMDASAFEDLWEANFIYYKGEMADPDGQYDDLVEVGWRVPLAGQHIGEGDLDWRGGQCAAEGPVPAGHETEIDWLRFFWDLRSYPLDGVDAEVPSTQQILEALDGAGALGSLNTSQILWCVQPDGLPGFSQRWQSLALTHGVDPQVHPVCD